MLASALLCASSIFTPLRFHTPVYGIQYQPNGVPCYAANASESLSAFAKVIDDSYHEFVCGPVDYECNDSKDSEGNFVALGEGMLAVCNRPDPPPDPSNLQESLRQMLRKDYCRIALGGLAYTDIFVMRYEWSVPGRCKAALKWAVVRQSDTFYSATIVLDSLVRIEDVPGILQQAWAHALFQEWVGASEGCIE